MWNPDGFLQALYEERLQDHTHDFDVGWQSKKIKQFQLLLGDFPPFAPDMKPTTIEVRENEEYTRLHLQITTYPHLKMPFYLLIPKRGIDSKSKRPVVMAIHGHGYGSKEAIGLDPAGIERSEPGIHNNFAVELVKKGVLVAVPELIGFGDRRMMKDQQYEPTERNSCFQLASSLLMMGKTLAGLRINECRRLLDYLLTREDIDGEQIGIMGLSGGGLVGAYTAVLDERIKATVVSGYANTFKGSIMDRNHCLDNYIPNILEVAEMPDLLGLMVPRPLFIESGKEDKVFPIKHAKEAYSRIKEIYRAFDAHAALEVEFFDGGHEINGKKSYDWLIRQLT
ncbi:alpha/beta hydrolase family protein [Sutcliffiella horikoshii]|uniref:alpha/beta hydrolase family protein n=1 Tax=Sutcliffiella horikoshii TaxID=79883 RepID=UPI001F2294AD|nr:alpha/beta hydrolase family protein [Sutcliffiella horikoshii]MCG1021862.1 dienelactone hydrolase [Sutcliffiella horikoshii]